MKFLFNASAFKDRRKELRRNSTDAERLLWSRLRGRQLLGLKFFRQFSVGSYILDFCCPEKCLAIELDGGQHAEPEQKEYDDERTAFLAAHKTTVLRFWNNDVMKNIGGVLERIMETVIPPITPPSNLARSVRPS